MRGEALEAVHAALRWRCGSAALTPRHKVTVSSPPFEMLDMVDGEPRRGEPAGHHLVVEAQPDMRVAGAQLLALVGGEIDDQQGPAGRSTRVASAIAAAGEWA